jgi:AraC-like DNA-binding protein
MRLEVPDLPAGGAHAHDFLALAYFERGGGTLRIGPRAWPVGDGDAFAVPPGEVVSAAGPGNGTGWAVFFPPDAHATLLSWRAHPRLAPFVRGGRLSVPRAERAAWSERFATLERELRERREGYAEAAVAHVSLLLVAAARLDDTRLLVDEPLVSQVFEIIERRFREPLSLRDVARELGLTPGHLTTLVRRRTSRTVLEWIVERRMAEARRLLTETDLTAQAAGEAVGYADPGYFARVFRRTHGVTPLEWRRASLGLE